MHEAGIAVAIAAEIVDRGLDPSKVRLLVSGGHGDLASFDAALRAQLEVCAPSRGLGGLRIVHNPVLRLCANCAATFRSGSPADLCPGCGGSGLVMSQPESVELEWEDPDPALEGPDGSPPHDARPSAGIAPPGRLAP